MCHCDHLRRNRKGIAHVFNLSHCTDDMTNPYEMRLGKYVDLDVADDVVGIRALRQIKADGIKRHQPGLILDGDTPAPLGFRREDIQHGGTSVGVMTICVWSPRMAANIGYALISVDTKVGETVQLMRDSGPVNARLVDLPFL